jgi:hypothetical protein
MHALTYDEGVQALACKTGLTADEWLDFFACSPAQQAALVQTYADMSWTKSHDTFADVLNILNVLGTIAGVVSGVATAAAAVAALRSL